MNKLRAKTMNKINSRNLKYFTVREEDRQEIYFIQLHL